MSWTDDFSATQTDPRFDVEDERINAVHKRVAALERRMQDGFTAINARVDALQHTLLQLVGGGVIVALIGLIATQV